jgi:hypothetical protein
MHRERTQYGEAVDKSAIRFRVTKMQGIFSKFPWCWTILSVLSNARLFFAKYNNYCAVIFSAKKFVIPNIIPSRTIQNIKLINSLFWSADLRYGVALPVNRNFTKKHCHLQGKIWIWKCGNLPYSLPIQSDITIMSLTVNMKKVRHSET